MKVSFYYHVPFYNKKKEIFIASYIGVFIDSIARNIDTLYLFLHEARSSELKNCDYKLKSSNIVLTNLGFKTSSLHRFFLHNQIISEKILDVDSDVFLVRAPTPLAPHIHKYLKNQNLSFLIVGSYLEMSKSRSTKSLRDVFIKLFLKLYHKSFLKIISRANLIVNSNILKEYYEKYSNNVNLVKTTTLSNADFYKRDDTCLNDKIELLYTGRIDIAKGLVELVKSVSILVSEGINVNLNIVGWEEGEIEIVKNKLVKIAKTLEIDDRIYFHGKKTIGNELNQIYRKSDIYLIPSYSEGFPRTIWESMANSLPVIASSVGSIPNFLTHEKNVFLIKPRDIDEIVVAVKTLIYNKNLRKKIIREGLIISRENTLEIQSKKLISLLHIKNA